ncbi:hypothetical protein SAMN04488066_104131 [Halorubrum aquaticum]|uniref:DUF7964 domain-containing protein n=1 Tax=Halorubrum aquaticum TaxID=387340 RepID=A0A1I3A540_9EURY|nr:hypothetical protein [Halorubrum aquaticum]SFH44859.1 hypothetical protein SAMN04488066_104131 [Halorubrum aquaticum]
MISGLPDRPLLASETLTLSHERDNLLVIPTTPDSLVGDDGTLGGIRDILVFTANVVASLAYTDADGWTVVAKATDPSKFGLCSFARREADDSVIWVESEETDRCEIRNPSLHACYGG